jgi:hypothetical protein
MGLSMNKTYLELVNDVLIRLREAEVQTVSQNSYSKLIGKFINDGKRQVEDAWSWNALRTTITIPTVNGTSSYTLTGSGVRFKVITVVDDTTNSVLDNATYASVFQEQLMDNSGTNVPAYYAFNGVDSNNDTKVEFYPTPNDVYSIKFSIVKPQAELSDNSTVLIVPNEPVIFYAYAKALAERGEDGGLNSGEAYQLYLQSLADHIAIESSRTQPDIIWTN